MESALRWIGIYLLNLLVATVGVLVATGIFLNVVLKPIEPLIGHSTLFASAKGPYYPLPLVLALVAGYIRTLRFKGNYGFWVWVLPALYLVVKMVWWKSPSILASSSWGATMRHFFVGETPYYPEQDVTLPLYTSVTYAVGALLGRSWLLRMTPTGETASGASDQQE
jgi:hypothetical protein